MYFTLWNSKIIIFFYSKVGVIKHTSRSRLYRVAVSVLCLFLAMPCFGL